MSVDKTVFLKILDLSPDELKTILQIAVNLLYADGVAEIEEWNLITLIPALLDVIKADTPGELKKRWEEKLTIASQALEHEKPLYSVHIKNKIKDPEARKACILLLFMIAASDKKVHARELDFIMKEIAGPWKISKEELVGLLRGAETEIHGTQNLISMIRDY